MANSPVKKGGRPKGGPSQGRKRPRRALRQINVAGFTYSLADRAFCAKSKSSQNFRPPNSTIAVPHDCALVLFPLSALASPACSPPRRSRRRPGVRAALRRPQAEARRGRDDGADRGATACGVFKGRRLVVMKKPPIGGASTLDVCPIRRTPASPAPLTVPGVSPTILKVEKPSTPHPASI